MRNIKNRIERLESARGNDVTRMSNAELEAELARITADPEIRAWLDDGPDNDPLRLELLKLLRPHRELYTPHGH